jgi:prenyltransferase beta subunit
VTDQPDSPQTPARPASADARPAAAKSVRNLVCAIGIACLGVVILALAGWALILAHPGWWRAWSDGRGIYVRDGDPDVRPVVWQPPEPVSEAINANPDIADGAYASRAHLMVFTRKPPGADHADLYMARFDGARWSAPEPIVWLNTSADEFSPTLSRNGRALFFASDRKGGMGGLDLYVSWWDGAGWTQALNLGSKVNSEFDECDPCFSPDEDALYFASNRPGADATPGERKARWDETVARGQLGDLDIFVAEGVSVPSRKNPLRDAAFRKAMITQLGGSPETEAAVLRSLNWLKANQEPDGHWDMVRHGGQKGQDIAGTALAVLSYLGWGAQYTEEGEFAESLYKGVRWLKAQAIQKQGNFAKGVGQGMYGHGMATIALAESYAVTKDETLREPLEKAVQIIIDAQNRTTGGWRYDAKPPKTGDTSVTGWQVMALHSARSAGLAVPDETYELARRWMTQVAASDGSYGYQDTKKITPAMTAEGMFVSQLVGAKRAERRQQQTAAWLTGHLPDPKRPDFYYWYYACLALYQQQGPDWTKWNDAIKPALLAMQDEAGTWEDGRYKQFGKVGGSAVGALCLEVYYRYLWKLDQETDPVIEANKTLGRTAVAYPDEPADLVAARVAALSSPSVDRSPRFTRRGDFVYFSSDRPGGLGGMDVYRSRIDLDEFRPPENAGPRVNTAADDASPSPACHGSLLLVVSDRKTDGADGTRLYTQVARELVTVTEGWRATLAGQWLLGLEVAAAVLIVLLVWITAHGRKSRTGARVGWAAAYVWAVLVIVWLALAHHVLAHPERWRRHTDGGALTVRDGDPSLRRVVSETPLLLDTQVNTRPNILSVATTAHGRMMVFSRQLPTETDANLHMMTFDGAEWSEPVALDVLNTESDEKSPALSADGTVLLFQSDRPGGRGGSDLYVAHWDGKAWAPPLNLGEAVNGPAEDCDPAPAPDGRLYFASDRGGETGKLDIFCIEGVNLKPAGPAGEPGGPAPSEAVRVEVLSSPASDRSPTFTRHGDYVYLQSDRGGGAGGMDLWRSRILAGAIQPPEHLRERANSPDHDLAPAPACNGIELLMTSDRVFSQRRSYLLYSQVSWEVSSVEDWEAFRWLERSKWWLLALLVGLLILAGLLVWYFKRGRYSPLGQYARCLVVSLLFHGALLVLLSLWMIGQELHKRTEGPMEVAVDARALASERLAQEIRESVNEMPNTDRLVYVRSDVPYQELPDYEPVNPTATTIVESDFVIERADVHAEIDRVEIAERIQLPKPKPATDEKPALRLKPVDLALEEGPPKADRGRETPGPVEVAVAPVETADQVSQTAGAVQPSDGSPRKRPTEMAEGALPEVTGSDNVAVAKATPPARAVPHLEGPGEALTKRIPPFGIGPDVLLGGGLDEGTGRGDGSDRLDPYLGRRNRRAMARFGGGGDDTEQAIALALDWLKRRQESDGSWSLAKHGGAEGHDIAATGFAMLAFFGWNIKHTEPDTYDYHQVMAKAVKWLLDHVGDDGDLTGGAKNGMYDQGIATMALAEAYGLTKDPALREPLERAVDFIIKGQSRQLGGWRYRPGSKDNDTSVVGWQVMALSSARLAGIEVPDRVFQLAGAWLDQVASGPFKGRYAYQQNRQPSPAMTAEGMFCRQLMGTPPTDQRQAGSAAYLKSNLPNPGSPNYYYWYYACLALHQHRGPLWQEWNARMKPTLLTTQIKQGDDAGSWPDKGQWTKGRGGKIMSTAMSALSLEVYYRYLPMYALPEPAKLAPKGEPQ